MTEQQQRSTPRRFIRLAAFGTATVLFAVVIAVNVRPISGQSRTSTGVLSGTVTADQGTVRAFRVRAQDVDRRITYTVFTNKGRYQIFNLPPSFYEVSVLEDGFESPVTKVQLTSGQTATADVALKAKPATAPAVPVQLMDFDELYPPGPGRDILVSDCFGCHGPAGWHSRGGKTEEEWRQAVARMFDQEAYEKRGKIAGIGAPPAMDHPLTEQQKETVIKYLAATFPKGHSPRSWKLDTLVRDEDALAQAVYIQYEYPIVKHADFGDEKVQRFTHDVFISPTRPGVLWVSGIGSGSIMAVNTRDLNFETRTKEWRIPHPQNINSRPHGIIESQGKVYYAGLGCDCVGEFDPKTEQFQQFPAPTAKGGGHTLRADSKGNVWFSTVYGHSRINKVDVKTKKVTEYNPVPGANWYGIVVDKQDRVWAVGYGSFFGVIMYDQKTDKWTTFKTSATNRRVTIDPNGKIWANQYFGNAIAKIDPDTGKVTEYKLPLKYGNPYEGWSDGEGNIWVENEVYNSLVRFEPKTEKWTFFPFPQPRSHAPKIEIDAEGTIWDAGFSPRPGQLRALKPKGNVPQVTNTASR